jgi:hypothetical protein
MIEPKRLALEYRFQAECRRAGAARGGAPGNAANSSRTSRSLAAVPGSSGSAPFMIPNASLSVPIASLNIPNAAAVTADPSPSTAKVAAADPPPAPLKIAG